jgi:hypothetical protein
MHDAFTCISRVHARRFLGCILAEIIDGKRKEKKTARGD